MKSVVKSEESVFSFISFFLSFYIYMFVAFLLLLLLLYHDMYVQDRHDTTHASVALHHK